MFVIKTTMYKENTIYLINYLIYYIHVSSSTKTCLKIPKGSSEAINRRTHNTMTKGKGTNNALKNTAQKTKTEHREPH